MTTARVEFNPPIRGNNGEQISSSVFDEQNVLGNPPIPELVLLDGVGNPLVIKFEHEDERDGDLALGLMIINAQAMNRKDEVVKIMVPIPPGKTAEYNANGQIVTVSHLPANTIELPYFNNSFPPEGFL